MRRRLLVLSVSLAVAVLVLLTVPLLRSYAESRAVDLHQQRLAAATRFASLADDGSTGVRLPDLEGDLARFDEVVGSTRTWVVGHRRQRRGRRRGTVARGVCRVCPPPSEPRSPAPRPPLPVPCGRGPTTTWWWPRRSGATRRCWVPS
ncbi:MAG: hypothetical protein PGN15_05020 [Aeromicrobium erythreum]